MVADNEDISAKIGLKKTRRVPWLWIGLVVVALGAGATYYLSQSGSAAKKQAFVTEPVTRMDMIVTVSAVGTIEPTDMFDISSELSGTISEVLVDYNDTVKVGDVMARLDTTKLEAERAVKQASYENAIAGVAMARATLEESRKTYQRGLELKARGVESETTFFAQEAAYTRAQADLQAALASQRVAKANLAYVDVDLAKSCICSPVNGIVLDRDIDPGQIVAASLSAPTLFTVAEDLTRMELQVYVDEADIGMVAVGQEATFTVDAYDERSFPARILQVRFASETVDGVVSYKAILSVENEDLLLRPGMTASADIVVAAVENALVVPSAALRYAPAAAEGTGGAGGGSGLIGMVMPRPPSGGDAKGNTSGKAVYVLRNGVAERVPVTVGESDGTKTVITSGELSESDLVITDEFDAS
ncbi:efflux RND transporter periplasmic adaptor subunit [Rhodalgimonas zhirmunskyi]|uniref:Efflux RND transporter periplasmic adaptor subunit n=1 Tax=Rhodalgimonas zhirmunskyi TaxID=2964767 RepID=A0AAJ1X806_9RHOB|nr:efflux RND transporter periplasmic adaptor subunit [Rhodoalgimonas zhirmunskyi]MDQ2095107.1 efflux RND transporter periplasmic adaptor subunit [Rhodoalgimonas zhirmunskyi]